jgi:hypothetical protein
MNIDSDDETDLELGGETVRIKQWKVRKWHSWEWVTSNSRHTHLLGTNKLRGP